MNGKGFFAMAVRPSRADLVGARIAGLAGGVRAFEPGFVRPTVTMSDWSEPEIGEAIAVVVASGVPVGAWTVLSRSNRLVLALGRSELIAKAVRIDDAACLVREFAVARHVAARKGPVAPPASGASVLLGESVAVSLWESVEALAQPSDMEVYNAYLDLRHGLDSFAGPLPDFREAISRAARLLDTSELRHVSDKDFTLLRAIFASSFSRLAEFRWTDRVLHGDPHTGNVTSTRQGPRWLDLESVCIGPVEWDLSALPSRSRALTYDPALLTTLAQLRRACIVVWCSSKTCPSVDETDAIAYHLEAIKAEAAR